MAQMASARRRPPGPWRPAPPAGSVCGRSGPAALAGKARCPPAAAPPRQRRPRKPSARRAGWRRETGAARSSLPQSPPAECATTEPSGDPACCRAPPDIAPAAPTAGTPRTPTDTDAPTTPQAPSGPTPAPGATARCPYRKCWARRTPQGRRRLLSGLPGPWPQFAYSWEAIRSPQRGFVGQDGILRAGWQPAPGGHLQTSTGGLPTRRRLPTPNLRILHKLWGGPPGRGALWARTPSSRGWNNWVSIMQSARRPTGASAANRGVRPTINADCAIPGKTSGFGLPTCPTSQHLPPLSCLTLKSLPLITHILLREPPDQIGRASC